MQRTSRFLAGFLSLAAAGLLPSAAQEPEYYKLEDTQGRVLEAEILAVEGNDVTLKTKAGKKYTLPLDKFSDISRADIQRWQKDQAEGGGAPDWNVEVVSESPEKSVYRTRHFEINCDTQLSASIVSQFTPLLEGAFDAVSNLSVGLLPKPMEGDYFNVGILEDERSFRVLAGDLPETAVGVYHHDDRELMLPISRLGITKVDGAFTVRPAKRNPALMHEATLLLLQHDIEKLPPWLVKGAAEYIAAADYKGKKLVFDEHEKNIARHLQEFYKLSPKALTVTPFNELAGLAYPDWAAASEATKTSYTSSALLFFYFLADLDNKGRNLRTYTQGLVAENDRDESLEQLFNGRDFDRFTLEMRQALARVGLIVKS